jgi:very-short-patch-repair endonuclease
MPSGLDPVKLQRAKELRREMTPEERMLWLRPRANRLGGFHFYRQKVLAGFIVDVCCPEVRLVVEVDGSIHEQQVEYDAERDAILQANGWRVSRISNDDVRSDTLSVLARILAACRDSKQHLPEAELSALSRRNGTGLGVRDPILSQRGAGS